MNCKSLKVNHQVCDSEKELEKKNINKSYIFELYSAFEPNIFLYMANRLLSKDRASEKIHPIPHSNIYL